jgi:hypothetical protein
MVWAVFVDYRSPRKELSTAPPCSYLVFTVICDHKSDAIDTIKRMGFCFGDNFTLRAELVDLIGEESDRNAR